MKQSLISSVGPDRKGLNFSETETEALKQSDITKDLDEQGSVSSAGADAKPSYLYLAIPAGFDIIENSLKNVSLTLISSSVN